MKPLPLLIFFSFLCSIVFQAQTNPNNQLKVNSKFSEASTQNLVDSRISDTCLDKKFSIVFYLINDSSETLTKNPLAIQSLSLPHVMHTLNKAFAPICLSFEQFWPKLPGQLNASNRRWVCSRQISVNGGKIKVKGYVKNGLRTEMCSKSFYRDLPGP